MNQQVEAMLDWILYWHCREWVALIDLHVRGKQVNLFTIHWVADQSQVRVSDRPVEGHFLQATEQNFADLQERLRSYCVFTDVWVRYEAPVQLKVHYWHPTRARSEAATSRDLLNPARRRLLAN